VKAGKIIGIDILDHIIIGNDFYSFCEAGKLEGSFTLDNKKDPADREASFKAAQEEYQAAINSDELLHEDLVRSRLLYC